MSKNKVLSENTIRRFQKLANIGTLSENYMQEIPGYPAAQQAPAQEETEGHLPEQMDEEEVEVGLEDGGDKEKLVRDLLKLVSQISGVKMDIAGEEEIGGDAGDMMGADGALEVGEEEDEQEGGEEDEEGGEGEEDEGMNEAEELDEEQEEEMDESASAPDDAMVESIVRRVTARLLEEAKKAGKSKKLTPKQKMALKKAQKGKKAAKPVEEATAATGGGPLLKKGGNKHDVWAGTSDMTLGKGDKGGQGGHKLSPLKGTKKNAV